MEGIEENNKLIAQFMGGVFHKATEGHLEEDEVIFTIEPEPNTGRQKAISRLKYPTSWDWLMPVMNKIRELYKDARKDPKTEEMIDWVLDSLVLVDINHSFKCAIKFIEWHNAQKKD